MKVILYSSTPAFRTIPFVRLQFVLASTEAGVAQLGKKACHSQVPSRWRGAPPELVFNVSNHRGSFTAVKCEGVTASWASGKPVAGLSRVTGVFPRQAARKWPWALDLHPTICHLDASSCLSLSLSGTPLALVSLPCRPELMRVSC